MTITRILTVVILLFFFGCNDLDVENKNEPDTQRVLAAPDDLKSVLASAFRDWFTSVHHWRGPALVMPTMADQHTASWGNFGWQDLSSEPRAQFDNTKTYTYAYVAEDFWKNMYSSLSSANDVLAEFDKKTDLKIGTDSDGKPDGSENDMVKAMAFFLTRYLSCLSGFSF